MTLFLGDCREKMRNIEDNTIDLIYLDPPFFTQRSHHLKTRDNKKEYEFLDTWNSIEDYLKFMKECLIECYRILKPSGSIFLHCDRTASHYLKVTMDEIFKRDNFQSEIIWAYRRWSNAKKGLLNCHQTIYFYSKANQFKFNTLYTDYSPTTNIDQILQERERNSNGKSSYKIDESGNVVIGKEKKGVPLSDVWYIPFLNPKAKERVGYPTQKPILLLERIINISTDEGDIVLDPFCGSGTTLIAAKLKNRNYIGIDNSKDAIKLTEKRLKEMIKTKSYLLEKGISKYIGKSSYELSILKSLDAIPVQRNIGIDGFLKIQVDGKPVSVRIQKKSESLRQAKSRLLRSSKTKQCSKMILIRTNSFEDLCLNTFDSISDDNILIMDAYDFIINKSFNINRIKSSS